MTDARPAPRFSAAPAHSRRINERDGRRRTAVTFGRRERTGKAVTAALSAPMVCVTILAGPRASEWFVTRLGGLRDGLGFAYLDGYYVFVSDPVTGRWGAIPAPIPPQEGRPHSPETACQC